MIKSIFIILAISVAMTTHSARANCADNVGLTALQKAHVANIRAELHLTEQLELKAIIRQKKMSFEPAEEYEYDESTFKSNFKSGIRESITYVARQNLSAAEKNELWDLSAREIYKIDPEWSQTKAVGLEGEYIFLAQNELNILIIDPHGTLWRNGNNAYNIGRTLRTTRHATDESYYRDRLNLIKMI